MNTVRSLTKSETILKKKEPNRDESDTKFLKNINA